MPPEITSTATSAPAPGASLRVTFYDSETSTAPRGKTGQWSDLVEVLSSHRVTPCTAATCQGRECPHKRGPAYSPAEFHPGTKRAGANVKRLHFASFDVDKSTNAQLAESARLLKSDGVAAVISSTHNHRPGAPRVRVVAQLSRPVTPEEWRSIWAWLNNRYQLFADESARDPARIFFEPSTPSDVKPLVWAHGGAPLDVDAVLKLAPTAPAARRQPLTGTEWSALLHGLDSGNRNQGLVRLAGFLMHKLDSEGALAADLIRTINQGWCKPPLEGREVETLIESVARRELAQRGAL